MDSTDVQPQEWAIRRRKWKHGIDPRTITAEEFLEYTETKLYEYTLYHTSDDNLWDLFKDDFKNVTAEQFNTLGRGGLQRLRAYLRCGGVYVAQNSRNKPIAQTLEDILEEEEQHKWTDDDIREAISDLSRGPITSQYITSERNIRPEMLARVSSSISSSPSRRTIQPIVQPRPTPPSILYTAQPRPTTPPIPPIQPIAQPMAEHRYGLQDPLVFAQANQATQSTSNTPYAPITAPLSSGAKLISEIAKIYTDEQKYDGTNGSLDHKLTIFQDICQRVELPKGALMKAFPTMLKGLAQDHFYSNQLSQCSYKEACDNLRNFFEGPGYNRRNLDKWNAISLTSISAENPEKSTYENVQLLINQLRQLQYGLTPALRTVEFLHNKLVTSCQGSPACRYAVSDPPSDLGSLINKLQSSITSYEKEQGTGSETFYTDRRYYSRNRKQPQTRNNTCFICKKEGCRSWKHSQQEQEESKARFRARNLTRLNTTTPNFERRFDRVYRQYIAGIEGDSDDEQDLSDIFQSLIIEDTNQHKEEEEDYMESTGQYLTQVLANRTCLHRLTSETTIESPDSKVDCLTAGDTSSRYNSDHFYGIVIDTGAAQHSTAGYAQFQALQHVDNSVRLDTTTKDQVTVKFGIGITSCIGSTRVNTPIGQIEFYVMMANTPFLLSLADMDKLGIYYNNLTDTLITPNQGSVPVIRQFGHCFLLWNTFLRSFIVESFSYPTCFLTTMELQRLHRRFGHPSVIRLQKVLERAGHDLDKETLEYITKYCAHCQLHGQSPGRFKFNLRDDVQFNHSIIIDIFYIEGKPILHVLDEGTRYQAGKWLQNVSAKHTWDTLRACWIDTYLGPPDQITTDAGKNFTSREFNQYASIVGTNIKIVPVEAHNSIGIVERYHAPIRRAYTIIAIEIRDIDREMALQMAFKAINDTAGPDGLIPTLLVYGAYPRMTEHDPPSPTITQRSKAIKKAMLELQKIRAKQQVKLALSHRNGPITTNTQELALNSDVLVWREGNTGQSGSWNGPYKLVAIEGESCVLALPNGNTTFRITSVKPYFTAEEPQFTDRIDQNEAVKDPDTQIEGVSNRNNKVEPIIDEDTIVVDTSATTKRPRGRPRKNPQGPDLTVYLQEEEEAYEASRQMEILGLLEKGVFEPVYQVPKGVRIFNSRFVDEMKQKGTEKAFPKSRLVVQAYKDEEKSLVLTQSPTIQRISQRIILCLAAIKGKEAGLYLCDISQAYVQSTTSLNRDFYINPPRELAYEMDLEKGSVLKVVKPLYGVPEAGNHWFKTYHSHHINALSMEQSTYDPCFLYNNRPFGLVGLQTDDTLFLADQEFAAQEQSQLEKAGFLAKEREQLIETHNLKFNGGIIHLESDNSITITQERQCKNLKPVSKTTTDTTSSRGIVRHKLTTKEQYIAQRARGAYIASVCQPEAAYNLSTAAQAINPTKSDIKALNKRIQWQIENAARGLRFVTLKKDSLRLLMFSDASFANNKDLSSQIGYILVMADEKGNANIIHWSSTKCKRVTRSILASELYGMAHGFDIAAATKSTVDKALQINLPLILCTDSKSLYDCLVKLGTTAEKRLMIDIMCLRQAYERREIAEVKWIKGESNPADSMTKNKGSTALKLLIDSNKIRLDVEEWVERE